MQRMGTYTLLFMNAWWAIQPVALNHMRSSRVERITGHSATRIFTGEKPWVFWNFKMIRTMMTSSHPDVENPIHCRLVQE